MLMDLNYESIKALAGLGIYEMRIDDTIGGLANIRIVFFDPPRDWQPVVAEARPRRIVWVLEVIPKRRDDWTAHDLRRFRASRLLLQKRCYER
jgi:hypothetical protein